MQKTRNFSDSLLMGNNCGATFPYIQQNPSAKIEHELPLVKLEDQVFYCNQLESKTIALISGFGRSKDVLNKLPIDLQLKHECWKFH
jgi:hypothetical protein